MSLTRLIEEQPTPLTTVIALLNSPSAEIAAFCEKHRLKLFVVFGSVARGRYHRHSDVDVAVWPEEEQFEYFDLYSDLVPLLGTERLDIVNLKTARPHLAHSIATGGRLLFETEPDLWITTASHAIRSYEDIRRFESYRLMSIDRSLKKWGVRNQSDEPGIEALTLLRRNADIPWELYQDDVDLRMSVERNLQLVIECAIDISYRLHYEHDRKLPLSGHDSFMDLPKTGLVRASLAKQLASASGFRNRLVHDYETIEDRIVHSNISFVLKIFTTYLDIVSRYAEQKGEYTGESE